MIGITSTDSYSLSSSPVCLLWTPCSLEEFPSQLFVIQDHGLLPENRFSTVEVLAVSSGGYPVSSSEGLMSPSMSRMVLLPLLCFLLWLINSLASSSVSSSSIRDPAILLCV